MTAWIIPNVYCDSILQYTIHVFYLANWQLNPETLEIAKIQQMHKGDEDDEEVDLVSESEEEEKSAEESDDGDNETVAASVNPFALLADDQY